MHTKEMSFRKLTLHNFAQEVTFFVWRKIAKASFFLFEVFLEHESWFDEHLEFNLNFEKNDLQLF